MGDDQSNATIVYRRDLHAGLWIIRVKPDGDVPEFLPGQYAELAIAELQPDGKFKLVRRAYSIASAPQERDYLEFFIALVDEGELTPKLHSLGEGQRLWLNPKVKGKFTLDPIPPDSSLVMVATGTGIAPFISMLQQYRSSGRWKRCALVEGVRYANDLGYEDQLAELQEADRTIQYCATVSREPEGSSWKGKRGRVNQLLTLSGFRSAFGWDLSPADTQVLLCGNPAMIDEVTADLSNHGFKPHSKKDPGQIHFERYW